MVFHEKIREDVNSLTIHIADGLDLVVGASDTTEALVSKVVDFCDSHDWKPFMLNCYVLLITAIRRQFTYQFEQLRKNIPVSCSSFRSSIQSSTDAFGDDDENNDDDDDNTYDCKSNRAAMDGVDADDLIDVVNYESFIRTMTGRSTLTPTGNKIHPVTPRQYFQGSVDEFLVNDNRVSELTRGGDRPLLAAVTIVRDEAIFLPIWLRYYSSQVDSVDIYIIDNDSSDGSTSGLQHHVIKASSDTYCSHNWIIATVKAVVSKLLEAGYQYVLFAEADEFVIPSPTIYPDGLYGYVSQMGSSVARATGYDLFHDHILYPAPIDLSRPILSQRGQWHPAPMYSKHVITNIALDWDPGFHTANYYRDLKPDEHLYLLHLKLFDYRYFVARGHWKATQRFNESELFTRFLSIHAHAVGNTLKKIFWKSSDHEEPLLVFMISCLLNSSSHSWEILHKNMRMMLRDVSRELIDPVPVL
jgi:hypothetical protein